MAVSETITRSMIKDTVRETLLGIGINVTDPQDVVKYQEDMHFLRNMRLQSQENKSNVVRKGLELIVAGLTAALALGTLQALGIVRT